MLAKALLEDPWGITKDKPTSVHLSCAASSFIFLRLKLMSMSICKSCVKIPPKSVFKSLIFYEFRKLPASRCFCFFLTEEANSANILFVCCQRQTVENISGYKVWTHTHTQTNACTSMHKHHSCAMSIAISDCLTLVF